MVVLGGESKKGRLTYLMLYITEPTFRTELCMTGVKGIACA